MRAIPQLKKALFIMTAGSSVMFSQVAEAATITLGPTSGYYIGSATPGLPASQAQEIIFLNALRGLATGGTAAVGGDTILRSSNVLALTEVPAEVPNVRFTSFPSDYTFNITGAYVTLKYGNGGAGDQRMEFYYTSGLTGTFDVAVRQALSSVTTFNPGTTPPPGGGGRVPDGGTTIACLGFALLGLGSMRKLIGSKA